VYIITLGGRLYIDSLYEILFVVRYTSLHDLKFVSHGHLLSELVPALRAATFFTCNTMSVTVMAALPNIGGALCSMPQSLADAHY